VHCVVGYHAACLPPGGRQISDRACLCPAGAAASPLPLPPLQPALLQPPTLPTAAPLLLDTLVAALRPVLRSLRSGHAAAAAAAAAADDDDMHTGYHVGDDGDDDDETSGVALGMERSVRRFDDGPGVTGVVGADNEWGLAFLSADDVRALSRGHLVVYQQCEAPPVRPPSPPPPQLPVAPLQPPLAAAAAAAPADVAPAIVVVHVVVPRSHDLEVTALRVAVEAGGPIVTALYPRYRCVVCGARYGEKAALAGHVAEHRALAAANGSSATAAPDVPVMRAQWEARLAARMVAAAGATGSVQHAPEAASPLWRSWYLPV